MEDSDDPMPDSFSREERVEALVRLLTLEKQTDLHFLGNRKPGGVGRIYGGQVIAQALAAAQATVEPDRRPHSLHAYFLRGGDEDFRIEFTVERDFDGRSFSNRRVIAGQKGVPILNMASSFQRRDEGVTHATPMPDVLPPEELEDDHVGRVGLSERAKETISRIRRGRGYEVRMSPRMHGGDGDEERAPYIWFRTMAPLPDDPVVHRLVLAYLSDFGPLTAVTLRHTQAWWQGDVKAASLDHSIWFHDDAKMDEWVVFVLDTPWAGNARGFGRGRFYTRDGRLIASVAQEGMLRSLKTVG